MEFGLDLEKSLEAALNRHLPSEPTVLAHSMRYTLLAPGKRIRPRIFIATSEMLGLALTEILPIALAIEMVHAFTLIHDDLPCMDNDDFRRGIPSNHKHFGESTALLAGDALMTVAVEVFLDSPLKPVQLLPALKKWMLSLGPQGVIGGQAAESHLNAQSTLADLEKVHRCKTGALFSTAILLPKELLGISDHSFEGQLLIQFADALGSAFQIMDDLTDGTPAGAQPLPTSILFYMSPQEASKKARSILAQATDRLTAQWGSGVIKLSQIAQEVLSQISATEHSHFSNSSL